MQADDIWDAAAEALETGVNVCLVTMVDATGDGPNRPGCRLIVTGDGKRFGTVGGGKSEYALVETARAALEGAAHPAARIVTMNHHDNGCGDGSGMICSGTQFFAVLCLTADAADTVRRVAGACRGGIPGRLRLSAEGLTFSDTVPADPAPSFDPDAWCYEETVGVLDTAILIGGGHVSLALSPLLVSLGMRVVVLDNRSDLATMDGNAFAHERRVIDYRNVTAHVPAGDHTYVCIMTFGHRHDEEVLETLATVPLRYLGMMGSAAKINQIRDHLRERGVPAEALDAVHAPIGLPITSNTPAEIAISIAAQIIAVRNGCGGAGHVTSQKNGAIQ